MLFICEKGFFFVCLFREVSGKLVRPVSSGCDRSAEFFFPLFFWKKCVFASTQFESVSMSQVLRWVRTQWCQTNTERPRQGSHNDGYSTKCEKKSASEVYKRRGWKAWNNNLQNRALLKAAFIKISLYVPLKADDLSLSSVQVPRAY